MLAAAVFLLMSASGCIKPPEAHLVGINIQNITTSELTLRCRFKIVNPNTWGADMEGMECAMISGENELASGKAVAPMPSIPGLSVTEVPVDVSLDLVKLFSLFKEYRQGGTLPYTLVAKPVFRILGMSLPVTITEQKELPMYEELEKQLISGAIDKIMTGIKIGDDTADDSDE